ncbi:uncharacterized protein Ecym_5225 [Eremothecium cymbalariae DBVPG|uniref:Uncharacterized protein n=1 Tax=Eremothecium cymbalariae (strain CBS 270.75 / DBVPG 7215 / KCTC 17166 / NRRL Y-17582) TaxID=931890 RepID=I6ND51_ERECY|nr:hypothetical protein Ecym_5225 [Eremothecium cymbalariae DBVPG\
MSSSHNQNTTFQERRNKLSIWVKKFIQPNREHKSSSSLNQRSQKPQRRQLLSVDQEPILSIDPDINDNDTQNSIFTVSARDVFSTSNSTAASLEVHPLCSTTKQSHRGHRHNNHHQNQLTNNYFTHRNPQHQQQQDSAATSSTHHHQHHHHLPQVSRIDFENPNDNASTVPLVSVCSSSIKSSTFSDAHSLQSTRATVFSNKTFDTNSSTIGIPPASIVDRGRYTVAAPSVLSMATSQTTQPPPQQQGRSSYHRTNSVHTSVSVTSVATILDS